MKTIGISEFKELINARLANPSAYVGKTLVLWNSTAKDYGIAYRVIEECCVDFNKANPENPVWFKYNGVNFLDDNNKEIQVCCDRKDMYGFKKRGILFESGDLFLDTKEDWLKFINTHQNKKGGISPNWTLVACAQVEQTGLGEDGFAENCEICKLQPTVDEWAEWMKGKCEERDLKPLVAFIKEKNPSIDFSYWNLALGALEGELIDNDYEVLSQLSHDDFEGCLRSCLGVRVKGFPYNQLWEFVQSYPS